MRFVVGLLIILILFFFGWLIFRGGGDTPSPTEPKDVAVTDYIDRNVTVVMTIDGEITGNDGHRAVRVLVNRKERSLEIIKGYENEVIQTQNYANNDNAFESFLYAIHRVGYGNARKVTLTDSRGVCPNGRRYHFEIWDGFDTVSNLWSASCSKNLGTYGGNRAQTEDLFKDQITDYNKLVRNVDL